MTAHYMTADESATLMGLLAAVESALIARDKADVAVMEAREELKKFRSRIENDAWQMKRLPNACPRCHAAPGHWCYRMPPQEIPGGTFEQYGLEHPERR